jgi:hypothetical protein
MLHPVGELSPSVYWRRRVLLLSALALALVSIYAIVFHHNKGDNKATAGASSPTSQSGTGSSSSDISSHTSTSAGSSTSASTNSASSSSHSAPKACAGSQLSIAAATDKPSYAIGERPKVALLVTNQGPAPCVGDLADAQIELRVLSGSARVWGSHDCAIEPGVSKQTLPVGQQIRREIEWSGLSSQVGCAGVRQRVPAGTYTLYALLGGRQGKIATFTFTG